MDTKEALNVLRRFRDGNSVKHSYLLQARKLLRKRGMYSDGTIVHQEVLNLKRKEGR